MLTPGEHKTVQARVLAHAEAIRCTVVSREGSNGSTKQSVASPITPSAVVYR